MSVYSLARRSLIGLAVFVMIVGVVAAPASGQNTRVDLELQLLLDVSGSVDNTEFALQRDAYVAAFNDPAVVDVITSGTFGSIAVNLVYWSASNQQVQSINFTRIRSTADANAFAAAIAGVARPYSSGTAIGSAINFATPLFDANTFDGTKMVIDVSGDGESTSGASVTAARDAAIAAGVDTINGIAIGSAALQQYYIDNLIAGDNAFANYAVDFSAFQAAILDKLLLEISSVPKIEDIAVTPTQKAVGGALDDLGAVATGELIEAINDIVVSGSAAQQCAILQQLAGDEATVGTSLAFDLGRLQLRNIGHRIHARRSGSQGAGIIAEGRFDIARPLPIALAMYDANDEFYADASAVAVPGASAMSVLLADADEPVDENANPLDPAAGEPVDQAVASGRLGVFASGRLIYGDEESSDNQPGSSFRAHGATTGLDYRFTDDLIVGAAFGYARSEGDPSGGGRLDVEALTVAVYGTYMITDALYLDGVAAFSHLEQKMVRPINIPSGSYRARSDTAGHEVSLRGRVGYDMSHESWVFGPVAQLDYLNTHFDEYTERNAGTLNLNVSEQNDDALTMRLGGLLSYIFQFEHFTLTPQVRAHYVHEFLGGGRNVSTRFASNLGVDVNLPTDEPDRDYIELGGGVSVQFKNGLSCYVDYDTLLGNDRRTAHVITGGIRFTF
ncbi:autotransporter domain-containing protein [Planctomycetales bacterium ZRK34]|nr:autotransporter domain-containing protein [Planctomycetales bacterium ZRK34]